MSNTFDTLFEQRVEPLLKDANGLVPAVEALEDIMPAMATPLDRAQVYHWLGTLHQSLAARALSSDQDAAKEHFDLSEEFFIKGIEEVPTRLVSRLALARYYLSFGSNPAAALEILSPKDLPGADSLNGVDLQWEHQRLAILSVVHALRGDLERCARQLEVAFSEGILKRLDEGVELATLEYLALRGVPFTPDSVDDIINRLKRCGFDNSERLDILRQRLLHRSR